MKCVVPSLIGLSKQDPALADFARTIPNAPQLDEFGGLKIEHFPDDGLSLYFDQRDRLSSVFFYSGRTADGSRYRGSLPEELSFEFGRGDAISKFGRPQKSGANWDTFLRDDRILHLKYADGGSSIAVINVFAWDRKEEA